MRISFEEFCNYMKENVPKYLDDIIEDSVTVAEITKNNGKKLTALQITDVEHPKIANCIYLEYYYDAYIKGKDIDIVVADIVDAYKKIVNNNVRCNLKVEEYITPDVNRIIPKLINYEKNTEMLEHCPHIKFQDMAITFRVCAYIGEDQVASCLLRYEQFDLLNMSIEELYDKSLKNYERLLPPVVRNMMDVLKDANCDLPPNGRDDNLFVISNEKGTNGATSVLLDFVRDNVAELVEDNYYLIPSSIHEFLAVPDKLVDDPEMVIGYINEVNKAMLAETDYLSNTLYHYDIREKKISMVNPPEERIKYEDLEKDREVTEEKEETITKDAR